jgi:hypothetical protein
MSLRSSFPPGACRGLAMNIGFSRNGTVIAQGVLHDNATARDFAALLPLRLCLVDYDATEKIADLPRVLTTAGAPAATAPVAGDICLYAPWGNLAVFYQDGVTSPGLVRLGCVTHGVQMLRSPGPLDVTISAAPAWEHGG